MSILNTFNNIKRNHWAKRRCPWTAYDSCRYWCI